MKKFILIIFILIQSIKTIKCYTEIEAYEEFTRITELTDDKDSLASAYQLLTNLSFEDFKSLEPQILNRFLFYRALLDHSLMNVKQKIFF